MIFIRTTRVYIAELVTNQSEQLLSGKKLSKVFFISNTP